MVALVIQPFHRGGFFESAAASIELQLAVVPVNQLRQPDHPIAQSVFLPSNNYGEIWNGLIELVNFCE
jgi:hypothetical protein